MSYNSPSSQNSTNGSSYAVELDRWGISNNATNATATSTGINNALSWASSQGYFEVLLPKGTYLIDEKIPVSPPSYITLNLNGSTLRIRDNALQGYAVVAFESNQTYSKLKNGKIQGDKDTHNYSSGGTHEFGFGVSVGSFTPPGGTGSNVRYITIEDLDIFNCTGDGVALCSVFNQIYVNSGTLDFKGSFEQGSIDRTTGALTPGKTAVRSTLKVDLSNPIVAKWGYCGLYGDGYGGLGRDITATTYDMFFYKSDNSFVSANTNIQFFDEVSVPTGASYAKVVLHQSTVPTAAGTTISVRVPEFPKNVYIEACNIHDCRRLGLSVGGAKYIYIRNNEIHRIKGTAPQGTIDIEDGYRLNQHICVEGNNLHDSNSGFTIAAGRYIDIIHNHFEEQGITVYANADRVRMNNNFFIKTSNALAGEVQFGGNQVYGSRVLVSSLGGAERPAIISDSLFTNSSLSISKNVPFIVQVDNCEFIADNDYFNLYSSYGSRIALSAEPQTMSNCVITGGGADGSPVIGQSVATNNNWSFNNVSFIDTLHQQGIVSLLPPGIYTSCRFINSGSFGFVQKNHAANYDFVGCHFQWDGYQQFVLSNAGVDSQVNSLRFSDCYVSGGSAAFIMFWDLGGTFQLSNTVFSYPNSTSQMAFLDFMWGFFKGGNFIVRNNKFSSSNAMKVFNMVGAAQAQSVPVIFADNTLETVVTGIPDASNHIKYNNVVNGFLTQG